MSEATGGGPVHHQLIIQKPEESLLANIFKVDQLTSLKQEESLPTGIAKVDGKYVPSITFMRRKYKLGKFETPDEAVLAYDMMMSQARSLLSGTEPRKHGEPVHGDYFETVESRIQVLEEDLVRLRQSEVCNATRVSIADARLRAADGKYKANLAQVHDQLRTAHKERDQARAELAQTCAELAQTRTELAQTRTELGAARVEHRGLMSLIKAQNQQLTQVKKELETERDQARTELAQVKNQLETECSQARTELTQVKNQLETERDQARRKALDMARSEARRDQGSGMHDADRSYLRWELAQVKDQLRAMEAERDQARRSLEESVSVSPKRTHSDMQAGSKTVGIEKEIEAVREKNAKLQLALDIKTSDLQKEIKRRRQCQCSREVVEILD